MTISHWKAVYDSVCGTSHALSGQLCQDACRATQFPTEDDSIFVACLADGAGSATHAAIGAETACDVFIRAIQRDAKSRGFVAAVNGQQILAWCVEIRDALADRAANIGVPIRQLACTFLAAVAGTSGAFFFQVGDGAIVIRSSSGYSPVFWPQSGEFAGTTNFLTDDRFEESLEVKIVSDRIDEIAGFTDGLERLVLRFDSRTVHSPFLEPMFAALRAATDAEPFFDPLRAFLNSTCINERTDDDKTLILATRLTQVAERDAVS